MVARRQAIAARLILAGAVIAIAAIAAVAPHGTASVAGPTSTQTPTEQRVTLPSPPTHITTPAAATAKPTPAALSTPTPAPENMQVKRILDIGPIKFGDYAWDTKGVPDGPLIITVDLAAQTLSVFRDGYEIGAAAILYGADEKPTPLGTFPILMKDATHVSRTYDNAPMPYTLRLTGDGVAIHGSKVEWGYATHGCIGVPVAFAKLLFAQAKVGDRVIITRGKTLATGQAILPAPTT
ncbi:L,D-transpeptidase family protein [Sphingomonas melonis]